ncbi:hypothetical protein [Acidovorax sp. MR-S7]|uniref:hypothetical protein n=1 Tax=Acidovorax sp. MR-S7 TaxID=1268622 RepID=UPI0003821F94|nr:hypothetical protein [Acidovorax sp. MR-S7]GAD20512.1 hypothetical protein AVS7_00273 [Acidovorax sp. MR-S7]
MHTIDNDWLARRGRWVNVTFLLRKGADDYLITLREGRVERIAPGPHVMPCWSFALVAEGDAWERFWADEPQPRFHDLMAMVRFKTLRMKGDMTVFMRNLLYFKALVKQLGGHIHAR